VTFSLMNGLFHITFGWIRELKIARRVRSEDNPIKPCYTESSTDIPHGRKVGTLNTVDVIFY
jgi:hypothetical protein